MAGRKRSLLAACSTWKCGLYQLVVKYDCKDEHSMKLHARLRLLTIMCFVDLDSGMCAVPDVSNGLATPADQASHMLNRQQQSVPHLNILLSTPLRSNVYCVGSCFKIAVYLSWNTCRNRLVSLVLCGASCVAQLHENRHSDIWTS